MDFQISDVTRATRRLTDRKAAQQHRVHFDELLISTILVSLTSLLLRANVPAHNLVRFMKIFLHYSFWKANIEVAARLYGFRAWNISTCCDILPFKQPQIEIKKKSYIPMTLVHYDPYAIIRCIYPPRAWCRSQWFPVNNWVFLHRLCEGVL